MMVALEKMSHKMINSGHKPSYIKRVMVAGWMSFSSKLKNSQLPGDHPAYYGRWKRKVMADKLGTRTVKIKDMLPAMTRGKENSRLETRKSRHPL